MPIDLNSPVDPSSQDWKRALGMLQGNILRGHGRNHTAVLLIQFEPSPDLRGHVRKLGESWVTSAEQQEEQAKKYRRAKGNRSGPDKQLFGNLFLSIWGYAALGYTQDELYDAFRHPRDLVRTKANWFVHGMEHKGETMADPPKLDWEPAYQNRLDAMLLLACDDPQALKAKVREAKDAISGFGKVLKVETAKTHRRGKFSVELFGFADGISQPHFYKGDEDQEPPAIVLEPDRLAGSRDAFGSYLVYRKLEQNVKGFLEAEAALADELRLSGKDRERAGAMIVGRFRDGTPLTKSPDAGTVPDSELNDFDYTEEGGDPGSRCPMHAHIRKVRPRGRVRYPRERIVRRGVNYGTYDPTNRRKKPPENGSGLLFLSFQRNIESQFGKLQSEWANTVYAPEEHSGQDPIAGQGWTNSRQSWPWVWGEECALRYRFGKFMRMLGGEFFFAPSTAFFRKLPKGKS